LVEVVVEYAPLRLVVVLVDLGVVVKTVVQLAQELQDKVILAVQAQVQDAAEAAVVVLAQQVPRVMHRVMEVMDLPV
jgi:hypothetical protein